MRKELLELKKKLHKYKEYAYRESNKHRALGDFHQSIKYRQVGKAYSSIHRKLDLILKNSVVKPLDERSPTDEHQQVGVSRPNDEAKSE